MFLFILESIGTSELIIIGIIALIFLGPRKLPQIARTIGKTLADFRSTTNEFKSTWEREVDFEAEAEALRTGELPDDSTPIARESLDREESGNTIAVPEIKPAQTDLFENLPSSDHQADLSSEDEPDNAKTENASDKATWL